MDDDEEKQTGYPKRSLILSHWRMIQEYVSLDIYATCESRMYWMFDVLVVLCR